MVVLARLVTPDTFKFVDVALVLTRLMKKALVEVNDVPFAFAKDNRPEVFKLVPVALVNVREPMLVIPDTNRLVVVAPIPATVRPPSIVVVTFVEPMWIPPIAFDPVPIAIVVVP